LYLAFMNFFKISKCAALRFTIEVPYAMKGSGRACSLTVLWDIKPVAEYSGARSQPFLCKPEQLIDHLNRI